MSAPFISSEDLSDYLGYEVDPDKAAISVDTACDVVRKTVEQDLSYAAGDEVLLDSEGTDTLLLPESPVYSVSSVVVGGVTLTAGTHYVLDREQGSIRTKSYGQVFLKGRQVYTVVYTHGYVSDDSEIGLPADVQTWPSAIRMVALQLATRIYDQGIVSQETVGGVSMSYATPEAIVLTARERSLLEKSAGVGRRR